MCAGTGFLFLFFILHKQHVMLLAHSNKYTNTPKPISTILLGWTLGSLTIAMLPLGY